MAPMSLKFWPWAGFWIANRRLPSDAAVAHAFGNGLKRPFIVDQRFMWNQWEPPAIRLIESACYAGGSSAITAFLVRDTEVNQCALWSFSDTHGLHNRIEGLPDGDVLVHAGDFMNSGYDPGDNGPSIVGWENNRLSTACCAAGITTGISRTPRSKPDPFSPMPSTWRTPGSRSAMPRSGDRRTPPSF
jgi:hypothetical protein